MAYKITLIDEAEINAMASEDAVSHDNLQDYNKKNRQEVFLAVYEKTLSIKVATDRGGVSPATYRYWKRTDAEFARKLNAVIQTISDELTGVALQRAMGYAKIDDETGEAHVDAHGAVIRYGGSDKLMTHFLERLSPVSAPKMAEVAITINLGALLGPAEQGLGDIEGIVVKSAIEQDSD